MFVIVRYYGLIGPIPVIMEYFVDMSQSVCFFLALSLTKSLQSTLLRGMLLNSMAGLDVTHSLLQLSKAADFPSSFRHLKPGNRSQFVVAVSCNHSLSDEFTVTLVIRTYALYDRSRRILALLIITHVGGAVACLVCPHGVTTKKTSTDCGTQVFIVTSRSPIDTPTVLPFTYILCDLSLTDEQGIRMYQYKAQMDDVELPDLAPSRRPCF